jgi:hypothetical protein
MKFLVYLMTLLFSTAVAQNPTILQGSYISNVFGNSNFVLNPNAQTNVANVTTVTATVARSTTTPLVATSEFTVAIGTANGTATWATRAFDAGMKGQNCEARFSYRGFAATSIVQIKQSTNVVASLTLTPATDPRIASINFPCGDLSAATTFVVTDTAILAGTNEIGGIYVGLATNMANVAQAELVVSANRTTTQSITNGVSTTVIFANENNDVYGEYDPATGIFTAKRSGEYFVQSMILYGSAAWTAGNSIDLNIMRDSNVICSQNYRIQYTSTTFHGNQASCHVTITVGQQIKVQTYQDRGSATDLIGTGSAIYNRLQIYRFPSSSELVVTPERQNTWAGVVYTAEAQSLLIGTPEPTASTPYTSALWNQPTKLKGKASVTTTNSGNDLGFSVANLPVGNYKLDVSGLLNASSAAVVGARVQCNFRLIETTTTTEITSQAHQDSQINVDGSRDYTNSFTGVFNNTSVGTRNFRIEAQKQDDNTAGNVGYCQAYSNTIPTGINTKIAIIMTPLDQPSNSALYVQGPVKAAETGAAIPAGYVGEKVTWATAPTATVFGTSVADWTNATISLNPGVHLIIANIQTFVESGTTAGNDSECNAQITDSAGTIIDTQSKSLRAKSAATGQSGVNLGVVAMSTIVNVTAASTVYKIRAKRTDNSGTGYCELSNSAQKQSHFYAIRIN